MPECVACGSYVDDLGLCVDECHDSGWRQCSACYGDGVDEDGAPCYHCDGECVVRARKSEVADAT